jgi:3-oxoacyl-(acyl-carrier-protein) synthase
MTSDALSYGETDLQGRWLERAIDLALQESGIASTDLDIVYGHGRGLPAYDAREKRVLTNLLKGRPTAVSCVLGNTGVTEAASALYSVAAALLGLDYGEAYPVATPGTLPSELAFVRGAVRPGPYRHALLIGSTEHGNNAAVVVTKPPQ